MELKEFVSEALSQIVDGVADAQKYAMEQGASINPNPANLSWSKNDSQNIMYDSYSNVLVRFVEFDVAVTVVEGTKTKGGVGVVIGPVVLGSHGQSEASNSSISRIRFSVPVGFPTTDTRTTEQRERAYRDSTAM